MKTMTCVAAVLFAVPVRADNPPDVRPLPAQGLNLLPPKCLGGTPIAVEIESAEELKASPAFADDESRAAAAKLVDFGKEKLVVFVWRGSGDRLTGGLVKRGGTALFTYSVGQTDDLKSHSRLFAVPKHAKVEFRQV